jgi:hypothetical protein
MYCQPYVNGAGSKPGLPLRLTGNSQYANFDLAPATVGQVYTQVIADLNAAETDLPSTYPDATSNTIRAHKNSAIAFKTRVYLSMQQYGNVITEANKIVNATAPFTAKSGVPNALQASVANVFKNPIPQPNLYFLSHLRLLRRRVVRMRLPIILIAWVLVSFI